MFRHRQLQAATLGQQQARRYMDDKGKFKTKIAAPKGKFKFGGTAIPSFMTHNQEAFPRPGDPLLKKGPMNLMPQNPHFAPEASGISEQSARDMLVQVMPLKRQASNNGEEIPGQRSQITGTNSVATSFSHMLSNKKGIKISDETMSAIIDGHAASKWYGKIWFWMRRNRLTGGDLNKKRKRVKWYTYTVFFGMNLFLWLLYHREAKNFCALPREDQRLYARIINGMNAGEFMEVGNAILLEEDPKWLLTGVERTQVVVNRMSKMGLGEVDWELQGRKNKISVFGDELSWNMAFHYVFWSAMYYGSIFNGVQLIYESATPTPYPLGYKERNMTRAKL